MIIFLDTVIFTSSVRHPMHITQAAVIGSDVATIPHAVLKKAIAHPLTDVGVARLWRNSAALSRTGKRKKGGVGYGD